MLFVINICTSSSTMIQLVVCICIKFKSLARLPFIVLLYAVFNLLIPDAELSASEEIIGEVVPINNTFLTFGENQHQPFTKRGQFMSWVLGSISTFAIYTCSFCILFWLLLWLLFFQIMNHRLSFERKRTPSFIILILYHFTAHF